MSDFVTSLSASANEFNWMEEAVVRRLLLVGGINAFACPMSRSAATAVLLKIIVTCTEQAGLFSG